MKVLWFTNTPSLGEYHLGKVSNGGGWIKAIDASIQGAVELHVAFYYPYKVEPFEYGKTHYYPIYSGNIIVENLKAKWLCRERDEEDLQKYLEIIRNIQPDVIHIHGTENPGAV